MWKNPIRKAAGRDGQAVSGLEKVNFRGNIKGTGGVRQAVARGEEIPMSVLLFLLGMYFLPSIVAGVRGHQSTAAIFVLNMLLGWTMIGWIVALIWSLSAVWHQHTIIVQQQPPTGPTITPNR
jgi:hypothetical protein